MAWPILTTDLKLAMAGSCLGAYFLIWVVLRLVWKPPMQTRQSMPCRDPDDSEGEGRLRSAIAKRVYDDVEAPLVPAVPIGGLSDDPTLMLLHESLIVSAGENDNCTSVNGTCKSPALHKSKIESGEGEGEGRLLESGEVAGDYSENWTKTFDMALVVFMAATLAALCCTTYIYEPALATNRGFAVAQLVKLGIMMGISVAGGLLARHFSTVDEAGYIITTRKSKFKVNYTRKLQHFAAYIIPLTPLMDCSGCDASSILQLMWGDWFTLLAFALMIKPVRERSTFFMLQFNSMDRPEDRPNTMKWIIGGNIIPGTILILIFTYVFPADQADLRLIFVFITGIGDGLAEPVGITWGRHKYRTRSCFSADQYTRSWEGSACVFLSGMVFPCVFYDAFANEAQLWMAIAILPFTMAYAEAVSPHTMDTPFLMGLGGLILWAISQYEA